MKRLALLTALILTTGLAAADITFDHSGDIVFESDLQVNQDIQGYFNSACGSGQAVTDIYDNGTLECSTVSGDTPTLGEVLDQENIANQDIDLNNNNIVGLANPSAGDEAVTLNYLQNQYEASGSQNLSQVLENGNVANQTIEFEGTNTSVGRLAYAYDDGGTAYGYNATADTLNGVAVGRGAEASSGEGEIAIGAQSEAEGGIALGYISSATGFDSVAIGNNAIANNNNEVSLGAFNGDQLNLNVTGNATVNENLEVKGELTGVDVGGSTPGLSEVLEQDNVANQSIRFEDSLGIQIGNATTTYAPGEIAIGPEAEAITASSIANDIAIGKNADASDIYNDQIALGSNSYVDEEGSMAFGFNSSAIGESSVAIGYRSNAPNAYEVTFGNLDGDELDLNVTGNATVHQDADVEGDLNVGGELTGVSTGGSTSGLSEVLEVNNTANQSIDLSRNNIEDIESLNFDVTAGDSGGIQINGDANDFGDIAIGEDSNTGEGTERGYPVPEIAIGRNTNATAKYSTALGYRAKTTGEGAVAIGNDAISPNDYETTLGNLNGEELDLNVTGNATIHGSGGLNMPNGVVVGSSSVDNSNSVALGQNANTLAGQASSPSVAVGTDSSTDGYLHVALGSGASASGTSSSTALGANSKAPGQFGTAVGGSTESQFRGAAVGYNSGATSSRSSAFGENSLSNADDATALGSNSEATGTQSVAIGGGKSSFNLGGASATSTGSVAIGAGSVSDQQYTARFGSSDQAYDVEVTGDLQVDGSLTGVSTGGSAENLSETLAAGNVANQTIEFDSSNAVKLGDSSTAQSNSNDIVIGKGADASSAGSGENVILGTDASITGPATYQSTLIGSSASGEGLNPTAIGYDAHAYGGGSEGEALAVGQESRALSDSATAIGSRAYDSDESAWFNTEASGFRSTALGAGARATGDGSVAVGEKSVAPNNYEATFGNLDGQELDLNVTGNATIHGNGGLILPNGIVIGGSSVRDSSDVAIGNNALTDGTGINFQGQTVNGSEVAIGNNSEAAGFVSTAVGADTDVGGRFSVGIGRDSDTGADRAINILGTTVDGEDAIGIGHNSRARSIRAISIGRNAGSSTTDANDISIGAYSDARGGASIAFGRETIAKGENTVAIGNSAGQITGESQTGRDTIQIGSFSLTDSDGAIALGSDLNNDDEGAIVRGEGSVAIGADAVSNNNYTARFGSDSQAYDVDVTGNLSVDGRINETNVRDISYSSGHTAWSSGLSTEEVNRFGTTSTESVEVERLDVQVKGGGTNSNFEVEAYDAGTGSVLGSTTAGTPINDVGTTSEGGDLTIRVTNNDGSDVTASITVTGHVVE